MTKALKELALLILVATAMGYGLNAVRDQPVTQASYIAAARPAKDPHAISVDAALIQHQNGELFVDARPRAAWQKAHIPGALSLPAQSIDEALLSFLMRVSPEQALVVYCKSARCHDSHSVVGRLRELGFSRVQVMTEGFQAWQNKSLPVERS